MNEKKYIALRTLCAGHVPGSWAGDMRGKTNKQEAQKQRHSQSQDDPRALRRRESLGQDLGRCARTRGRAVFTVPIALPGFCVQDPDLEHKNRVAFSLNNQTRFWNVCVVFCLAAKGRGSRSPTRERWREGGRAPQRIAPG